MESRTVMDIHRLRVLNFNIISERKLSKSEKNVETPAPVKSRTNLADELDKLKENVETTVKSIDHDNNNKENVNKPEVVQLQRTECNGNGQVSTKSVHSSSHTHTSRKSRNSSKPKGTTKKVPQSNTKILGILSKRKFKKKRTREKMIDIDEIKRKLSQHSITCSNRIKETIKHLSNESVLKSRKKRNRSKKGKAPKQEAKACNDTNEVKVLFTCKSSKFKESVPPKKRKRRRVRTPNNDEKTFRLPSRSWSFDDIFGFKRSNRFVNPLVYRQENFSILGLRRRSRTNPKQGPSCRHLKILSSKSRKSLHESNTAYKLPFHSASPCSKRSTAMHLKYENPCFEYSLKKWPEKCRQKSQDKVFTSQASYHGRPRETVALCADCAVKQSYSCPNEINRYESQKRVCIKEDPPIPVCRPGRPRNHKDSDENDGAKIFKYILFGLVMIVWLPCILVVLICWMLSYPLRPQNVKSTSRKYLESDLEVCPDPNDPQKKSLFSSFVAWIKGAEWLRRDIFQAATSVVTDDPCFKPKKRKRDRCWGPNPDRRYSLYHTGSRGWVVKPQKGPPPPAPPTPSCAECFKDTYCGGSKFKTVKMPTQSEKPPVAVFEKPKYTPPPVPVYEKPTYTPYKYETCEKCLEREKEMKKKEKKKKKKRKVKKQRQVKKENDNVTITTKPVCPTCQACLDDPGIKLVKHGRVEKKKRKGPFYKRCCRCFWDAINEVEDGVWKTPLTCNNLYIHSVRNAPCPWVYNMCPNMYPCFTSWCKISSSMCQIILFMFSIFVWLPPMLCFYCCMEMFCRYA